MKTNKKTKIRAVKRSTTIQFIVYSNGFSESLITAPELEKTFLKEYFADELGRNLDYYDRTSYAGPCVTLSSSHPTFDGYRIFHKRDT